MDREQADRDHYQHMVEAADRVQETMCEPGCCSGPSMGMGCG